MAITDIRVGEADFSLDEELSRIMRESPSAGGVASFVGLVRNKNDGAAVSRMTLEHYPGMTEKSLAKIAAAARERFHLVDVIVVHRVGELKVGDRIVLCLTSAEHRSDAFAGCEYIMTGSKPRRLSGRRSRRRTVNAGLMPARATTRRESGGLCRQKTYSAST